MEAVLLRNVEEKDQSKYSSRKGALVWFFEKSRDRWKAKYTEVKADASKLRKQLGYQVKAREADRQLAIQLRERVAEFESQNRQLSLDLEAFKKKR